MLRSKRKLRLAIATLCAFSLAAAACGSDSDSDGNAASAEASEASTAVSEASEAIEESEEEGAIEESEEEGAMEEMGPATGSPIKLGLIFGGTGRTASSYGDTDDTADAWAAYWNEHGGVNGHPVEVISIDMQGDVAVAAEAARELVENEGIVGVMIQDSATETAVSEFFAGAGVPVIGGSASNFDNDGAPNTQFVVASTAPGSFDLALAAAAAAGATHFSGIVCAEVPTCLAAGDFYSAHAADHGLDYTPIVSATHGEPSYTSFCLAVTSDGADAINLAFAASVMVAVAEECVAQGFEGRFNIAAATIDGGLLDEAGLEMGGYLSGFPWWADDPAVETFRVAMAAGAPEIDIRKPATTNTWASLELFRKALADTPEGGTDVTSEDVLTAYYAIEGETLGGLLPGPVTFTKGDGPQPDMPCGWLMNYDAANKEFSTVTIDGGATNGASGELTSFCAELS